MSVCDTVLIATVLQMGIDALTGVHYDLRLANWRNQVIALRTRSTSAMAFPPAKERWKAAFSAYFCPGLRC